jgi:hypothetical protein
MLVEVRLVKAFERLSLRELAGGNKGRQLAACQIWDFGLLSQRSATCYSGSLSRCRFFVGGKPSPLPAKSNPSVFRFYPNGLILALWKEE